MRHDKYSYGAQMARAKSVVGSGTRMIGSRTVGSVIGEKTGGGGKPLPSSGVGGADKSGGVGAAAGHAARIGGYARGSNY
jgi:hypothetical protein